MPRLRAQLWSRCTQFLERDVGPRREPTDAGIVYGEAGARHARSPRRGPLPGGAGASAVRAEARLRRGHGRAHAARRRDGSAGAVDVVAGGRARSGRLAGARDLRHGRRRCGADAAVRSRDGAARAHRHARRRSRRRGEPAACDGVPLHRGRRGGRAHRRGRTASRDVRLRRLGSAHELDGGVAHGGLPDAANGVRLRRSGQPGAGARGRACRRHDDVRLGRETPRAGQQKRPGLRLRREGPTGGRAGADDRLQRVGLAEDGADEGLPRHDDDIHLRRGRDAGAQAHAERRDDVRGRGCTSSARRWPMARRRSTCSTCRGRAASRCR
jgi:hypothetical protein